MEETLFRDYFGNSPKLRILEYLIVGRTLDYSLTDITKGAEVAWKTTLKLMPELVKSNVVVPTRTIGNAKLYKINEKSLVAKLIIQTFDNMLALSIPQEIKAKSK